MTEHDIITGQQMLQEEFIQRNPAWVKVSQWGGQGEEQRMGG